MTPKRLTRSFASAVAVLTLAAACGSGSTTSTGADIVIGTSIPLTGPIPLPQILDGYQAAVDDVNAAGGITIGGQKHQVKLIALDNRTDSNVMTQQVRTLTLQDNAVGLLGACCQLNIDVVALADALKIPVVFGALPLELMPPTKGYAWDSFQKLGDASDEFFKLISTVNTDKRIVIVTNNDAQGSATAKAWSDVATANGYQVVATGAEANGTTDFSDVIGKGKSGSADILIAAMIPPDCFSMWKQMKALGYVPKVAIGLQCAQTPGWSQLGSLGDGTLVVLNWTKQAGLPSTNMIVSRFSGKYPALADLAAAPLGYHEATILLTAIEKAGSTDRAKVNDAIGQLDISSTLGPVKFGPDHKSPTPTYIGQWGKGDIVQVYPPANSTLVVPVSGLQ